MTELPGNINLGDLEPADEMIDAVRIGGIIAPVLVQKAGKDRYTVLAGGVLIKLARTLGHTDISAIVLGPSDPPDAAVAAYTASIGNKASLAYQLDIASQVKVAGGTIDQVAQRLSVTTARAETLVKYLNSFPIEVTQAAVAGSIREDVLKALVGAPLRVAQEVAEMVFSGDKVTARDVKSYLADLQGKQGTLLGGEDYVLAAKAYGHRAIIDLMLDGKACSVTLTLAKLRELAHV